MTILSKLSSDLSFVLEVAKAVATVALLGLTFKPNTDDLRESPAIRILEGLLDEGARIQAYDPVGMPFAAQTPRENVRYCDNEYAAAEGADAMVVATGWNQFRALDVDRLMVALREPVVVDLRNVYDPKAMRERGFRYTCVGRM